MNRKEFEQLQLEFAQQMFSYEQFCKLGYQLENKFCFYFYEYMEKEYKLMTENEMMQKVIILLKDKKGLMEVEKCIEAYKLSLSKSIVSLNSKYNYAKQIVNALNNDGLEYLEEDFKNYVMKYHPAVKMLVTKQEGEFYKQLKKMYFDNNYSGFQAVYDLNKNLIQPYSIAEDKYIETAEYYYKVLEQIKLDVNKKKNIFPYNKEEVFVDDLTIAAEVAEFKIKINKLLGINKSLHKDIIEIYGEDINL